MFLGQLDFDTRLEIKKKTRNLIRLYEKEYGRIRIPIDTEKLLLVLERMINKEILMEERMDKTAKGNLFPLRNRFHIILAGWLHFYEKRIVLGHEIGHILFSYSEDELPRRIRRNLGCLEERVCDEIGMCILCPSFWVEKFLREFNSLPYQLELFRERQPEMLRFEEIARRFEVPTRMLIRHTKRQFGNKKIKEILARIT